MDEIQHVVPTKLHDFLVVVIIAVFDFTRLCDDNKDVLSFRTVLLFPYHS